MVETQAHEINAAVKMIEQQLSQGQSSR